MKWASAVSERKDATEAVAECSGAIRDALGDERPDLAIVFPSLHHGAHYDSIAGLVRSGLDPTVLVGCSAGGVIGDGREIEHRPGLSVTAAVLPGVHIASFHVDSQGLPAPDEGEAAWEAALGVRGADEPSFVLLPDPFTFDSQRFLDGLNRHFPGSTKIGGLASGARDQGPNALYHDGRAFRGGAVGVALTGDVAVETIVAQGCRPIGEPMFVTRCEENVLMGLDGLPPKDVLQDLYRRIDARDRDLFRNSLFLGIVMRDAESEYRQGDFLIRNIMGFDPQSGALAVGAPLRTNLVVQFHLRDARTSAEDLDALLRRYRDEDPTERARGSLLFSCLGRGLHLYGRPDHDTDSFRRHLGDVPLGGFFCNGEIGPVQGTAFLHGYTSSFGLFRSRA